MVAQSTIACAQQETIEGERKVLNKVEPTYPEFARRISLKGTVKLEAVVASTGKVRAVNIKGGHPLLAQAAVQAVSNWKWETAPSETHENVEVRFGSRITVIAIDPEKTDGTVPVRGHVGREGAMNFNALR